MELDIAFLANVIGDSTTTAHFIEAAQARKRAMNAIFWNEEMGQWLDYWLSDRTTCKVGVWCKIYAMVRVMKLKGIITFLIFMC